MAPALPTPTRGPVDLAFTLPRRAQVSLRVIDLQGRSVRLLTPGTLEAGPHMLRWDARDPAGAEVPSGLYLCELRAGIENVTQRILVAR
jgi:flagellar hook assembly protein FlgD